MTLTITVEPVFLALTTTPSMAPSASDVTWPVRAGAFWAGAGTVCSAMAATPAIRAGKRRFVGIDSSIECKFEALTKQLLLLADHRLPSRPNPASKSHIRLKFAPAGPAGQPRKGRALVSIPNIPIHEHVSFSPTRNPR